MDGLLRLGAWAALALGAHAAPMLSIGMGHTDAPPRCYLVHVQLATQIAEPGRCDVLEPEICGTKPEVPLDCIPEEPPVLDCGCPWHCARCLMGSIRDGCGCPLAPKPTPVRATPGWC